MLIPNYTIRDAREEDAAQLSILITQLGYPCTPDEVLIRLNNVGQNSDYRTLVITKNDSPVGMAGMMKGFWYEKNGAYVRILAFVIAEDQRGKGVGKILIKAVEEWAIKIGANSVVLSSGNRDERKGAHRFYNSLGYEDRSLGFIKQL